MASCASAGSPMEVAATGARWRVYMKPNGLLGNAYMAAIKSFRYLVFYPQMLRAMERRWQKR